MEQRDSDRLASQVIQEKVLLCRKERHDYHVVAEERGILCPKSHMRDRCLTGGGILPPLWQEENPKVQGVC